MELEKNIDTYNLINTKPEFEKARIVTRNVLNIAMSKLLYVFDKPIFDIFITTDCVTFVYKYSKINT